MDKSISNHGFRLAVLMETVGKADYSVRELTDLLQGNFHSVLKTLNHLIEEDVVEKVTSERTRNVFYKLKIDKPK